MNDMLYEPQEGSGREIKHPELIPSKAVREYMEQQGRVLIDYEKATLIYNHSAMDYTEKRECLKELLETTKDQELKEQIQVRLDYDERCRKRFYETAEDVIYKLFVFSTEDEEYLEEGYFVSGEVAVKCGRSFHEEFYVEKIKMITEDMEPEDLELYPPGVARRYFNAAGKLNDYGSDEETWTGIGNEWDGEHFENAYMDIPIPFQDGDLVTVKNCHYLKDKICVVECCKNIKDSKKFLGITWGDYSDVMINLSYLDEDAEFTEAELVSPVDVDYAEIKEDDPESRILQYAQWLLQGHLSLTEFQGACEQYRKNKKGNRT